MLNTVDFLIRMIILIIMIILAIASRPGKNIIHKNFEESKLCKYHKLYLYGAVILFVANILYFVSFYFPD